MKFLLTFPLVFFAVSAPYPALTPEEKRSGFSGGTGPVSR
jgi:hypothetical protein